MLDGQTLWPGLPNRLATLATASPQQRRRDDVRTIQQLLACNAVLQGHNARMMQALTALDHQTVGPVRLGGDPQAFWLCKDPGRPVPVDKD